jgi:hypothetical protein
LLVVLVFAICNSFTCAYKIAYILVYHLAITLPAILPNSQIMMLLFHVLILVLVFILLFWMNVILFDLFNFLHVFFNVGWFFFNNKTFWCIQITCRPWFCTSCFKVWINAFACSRKFWTYIFFSTTHWITNFSPNISNNRTKKICCILLLVGTYMLFAYVDHPPSHLYIRRCMESQCT